MKSLPELIFEVCEETHVPMAEGRFRRRRLGSDFSAYGSDEKTLSTRRTGEGRGACNYLPKISRELRSKITGLYGSPLISHPLQTKVALILFLRSMPTELRIPHPLRLTTFSKLR